MLWIKIPKEYSKNLSNSPLELSHHYHCLKSIFWGKKGMATKIILNFNRFDLRFHRYQLLILFVTYIIQFFVFRIRLFSRRYNGMDGSTSLNLPLCFQIYFLYIHSNPIQSRSPLIVHGKILAPYTNSSASSATQHVWVGTQLWLLPGIVFFLKDLVSLEDKTFWQFYIPESPAVTFCRWILERLFCVLDGGINKGKISDSFYIGNQYRSKFYSLYRKQIHFSYTQNSDKYIELFFTFNWVGSSEYLENAFFDLSTQLVEP